MQTNEPKLPLSDRAMIYAITCHENVNHKYDGLNYCVHLQGCFYIAIKYIHLIPLEDREIVLAAIWGHDTEEDTRETYNDIKNVLGERVADIIHAVTNEKGKTRKERQNEKYYHSIRSTEYAVFVKVCDRIANAKYSLHTKSPMYEVYKKEAAEFTLNLYDDKYDAMFLELNTILGYPQH